MSDEPDSNRLLDDVLAEVAPEAYRAELLGRTLKQVHRKRRMQQWCRGTLAAALVIGAWLLVERKPASRPVAGPQPSNVVNLVASSPLDPAMQVVSDPLLVQLVSNATSAITVIETASSSTQLHELDDDQLLALLDGQPALLVRNGPGGAELLVVGTAGVLHPGEQVFERPGPLRQ